MPGADLALLKEAAHEAGRIASSYFKTDLEIRDKGDGQGPVTEADIAVNAMLEETLKGSRPDYGWLSEETEDTAQRQDMNAVFVIDPIDGTRAFIEGSRTWAHSLAVVRDGNVEAAVVHLPQLELTFEAEPGQGARLNGDMLGANEPVPENEARVLSSKQNMQPEFWPGGAPRFERHFRSSLAYRLCLVAEGRFDGMLTLRPTWEWDIAAGHLIASEAGAKATTRTGATPIFNNQIPQIDGVLCAGESLHGTLLARL